MRSVLDCHARCGECNYRNMGPQASAMCGRVVAAVTSRHWILCRGADEDRVDIDMSRLGHGEHHRSRDVVGLETCPSAGLSKNGVSTPPGSIRVVRTPVPFRSARMDSPIAVTAHFVAE